MAENPPKSEEKQKDITKEQKKRLTGLKALNIAIEFGFIVVVPLLAFGYLGKWLDNKYDKSFFVLIGILLALAVTTLWFYKSVKRLMESMKDQ